MIDKKEYQKQYYQKNRQRLLEYHKDYYKRYGSNYRKKDITKSTFSREKLYSVWNNETDEVVIIDGNANECAAAMGISINSFYPLVSRCIKGECKKWTFKKMRVREIENVG